MSELRTLRGAKAPATLLPNVLERVGLADRYWRTESWIGPLFIAFNARGISAVGMAMCGESAFERDFQRRFGRRVFLVTEPPRSLASAVLRRLDGDRRAVLRFDLRACSQFERAVLMKALEIPRGEVRPYGWVAREIGRPKAVRAVGTALGGNPVPLLIPCHRVVRGDGSIGQYSLGDSLKRRLLDEEGVAIEELERMARKGRRFMGSDTTRIYCFPTCRGARRVSDRHRVDFADERAAAAAGYRACKICRPPEAS